MSDHAERSSLSRYIPRPALSWTDSGADIVLYDRTRGTYHALNSSASAIWRQLVDRGAEAEIVDAMVARFDVKRDAAAAEVSTFIAQALAVGLIEAA